MLSAVQTTKEVLMRTRYDIFAIGLVTSMLGVVYWHGTASEGAIPESADTAIKVATSGGTVIGQLAFG